MKRFLILIISILCVVLLASCNMQEQLEQMSENIKGQIIDMAGQFIEKNTESDTVAEDKDTSSQPDVPSDIPSDVPSDTVCDVPSDIVPDVPDVPTEPEIPEVPDYLLAERVKYPINKYMGITISKAHGVALKNEDYKHKAVYGLGRLEISLDECLQATPVTYFKISGMESNVLLDFDLSLNTDSYGTIVSEIHEFAKKYCLTTSSTSDLRRIEIGKNPDTAISAKDYALLLNLIYDDNYMQNGEKVGTTFLNPEIRLITGKMSTINLPYIQELMSEIKSLRNDEFLPIGGWSFSVSTEGKSPEEAFLKNEALKALVAYRNENYNTVEIHLSDFGWDTVNSESANYVAPSSDFTSEEIQANYILRAYLILNGMDVDKASYGMINDTDTEGYGIIAKDGTKKKAFTMLEYFKKKMNGMYFSEIVANGENGTYCYKFEDENGKTMYAVWSDNGNKSYTVKNLPENVTLSTYDTATNSYTDNTVEAQGGILSKVVGESVMFVEY